MKPNLSRRKTPISRITSGLLSILSLVMLLAFSSGQALAVCPDSGFEDEDGDLIYSQSQQCSVTPPVGEDPYPSDLDWNSFNPGEWTGTAPYREAEDELASGWLFKGIEDDEESNNDTAFAGGTKQDAFCPRVKGAKAPNKDDIKRVYLSTNTINDEVFLNLGWVRIPQNTTSASAHVAFEFNKSKEACGDDSGDLVERTDGDMLIVYDFEGGSAAPVIKLSRWTTDGNDSCDISNNSPPCWGTSVVLTDDPEVAEAAVNFGTNVTDAIGPDDNGEVLADQEFGEAGINLSKAGVFTEGSCEGFGSVYAVSRSSGNSGNAQMKDLVGPAPFELNNCGTIVVKKSTTGGDGTFGYAFTGLDLSSDNTGGNGIGNLTKNSFDLTTSSNTADITISKVPAGDYSVEETSVGTGFSFKSVTCKDAEGSTIGTITDKKASFTMALKDTVTCTYVNEQATLTVNKLITNACTGNANDGGVFDLLIDDVIKGDDKGHNGTTGAVSLATGSHTVSETNGDTSAVTEYAAVIGGNCGTDGTITLGGGDSKTCTITNTRLPHIKVTKHIINGSTGDTFDVYIGTTLALDNAVDGDSKEITVSLADSYTISEKNGDDTDVNTDTWLTNIACSDGSAGQGTSLSGIKAGSGDLVECQIYNIRVAEAAACVTPNNQPTEN